MTPRWWMVLVLGLAAPVVHAQTAPVFAPDSELADEVDSEPVAPYAPPDLPDERPTPRPFADAVWASGHWYWDGEEWRFNSGTWLARMPGYQFVNGYWAQDGDVWRWVSGGWAQPGSTEVEIPVAVTSEQLSATQAPPQIRVETPPPAPAANLTWAPGYWYWTGASWSWVDGTWLTPPRAGLVYVSPRWVRHGPSWSFVGGGWASRGSFRVVVPVYRHAGISVRWGHPHYFVHSWRRSPMVHHHWVRPWRPYHGPRYHHERPRYHHGPRYHQGPRYNGGRHHDGPRNRGGWRRNDGPRHHDASPVHRGGRRGHRD